MAKQVSFQPKAWDEFMSWQNDKKTQKRIFELIKEIGRDPFNGKGKPEPLKHKKSGCWSRRIDDTNRLVYEVTDTAVVIYSCKHHYGDLVR